MIDTVKHFSSISSVMTLTFVHGHNVIRKWELLHSFFYKVLNQARQKFALLLKHFGLIRYSQGRQPHFGQIFRNCLVSSLVYVLPVYLMN